MTILQTIYGDATVQEMPADSDGDIGYCVVGVNGPNAGRKMSGVQWTRDAAERDLASMHAHYLAERARPKASARDLAAADYFSGDESVVGAGPERRNG